MYCIQNYYFNVLKLYIYLYYVFSATKRITMESHLLKIPCSYKKHHAGPWLFNQKLNFLTKTVTFFHKNWSCYFTSENKNLSFHFHLSSSTECYFTPQTINQFRTGIYASIIVFYVLILNMVLKINNIFTTLIITQEVLNMTISSDRIW